MSKNHNIVISYCSGDLVNYHPKHATFFTTKRWSTGAAFSISIPRPFISIPEDVKQRHKILGLFFFELSGMRINLAHSVNVVKHGTDDKALGNGKRGIYCFGISVCFRLISPSRLSPSCLPSSDTAVGKKTLTFGYDIPAHR